MLRADPFLAHSGLSAAFNLGLLDPMEAVRARRGGVPRRRRTAVQCGGFRAPADRLAGLRLAPLLVLRRRLRDVQRDGRQPPAARMVRRAGRRRGRGGVPVRRARRRTRPRLGAPHPAADGARQLRAAARLAARGAGRLVPPQLRGRLRVGDDRERRRDEPVRRPGPDDHQAVRRRWRVHQPDERLLPRLPLRPAHPARRRTRARSPPATGRSSTAPAGGWPATPGWRRRCGSSTASTTSGMVREQELARGSRAP